jgi:hypothetical protein
MDMKTDSLRRAALALVLLLPGAMAVHAEPPNAALPPPSKPSGERAAANNSLAQRVMLYEEEPGNPEGKQAAGSVVWSTETKSADITNSPTELVVRADISVPARKMGVILRLRHDTALTSTSHTFEVRFEVPSDFNGIGVFNVPGFWMKPTMQTRGDPLAGLAVRVTPGYFLVGLSNKPPEREHNIQLLKDRPWFDVPIVYNNNLRAILSVEKGAPGEQAFKQAFGAWKE